MSSSKQKMEHYEGYTKRPSHRQHGSRDSVIGRSGASDRVSLGTALNEDPFDNRQVKDQRRNLRAVQEALDAAYDRIKHLEISNTSMNESLTNINRENRALKKEKNGLVKENEDLLDVIENLNKRLKRESSPRSAANASAIAGPQRKPSIRKPDAPRQQLRIDEQLLSDHSSRRSSVYEQTHLRSVPQPPPNPHPNPFGPGTPTMTYTSVPPTVSYAPSNASYSTAPLHAVAPYVSKRHSQNDGKYHLRPL